MSTFDVPIILIFFNRPHNFKQVFDKIKAVKPKQLFLVQDGPRGEEDKENIAQCRKIAEAVDWPCDVKRNYAEKNMGCGLRPFTGISWAFQYVEKAIILEDDCVPELSFFPYCRELLERYKNDERISYISGLNHFEKWDCGEFSYFFAKTGAIWGWATWKNEWDYADYYVKRILDPYFERLMAHQFSDKTVARERIKTWKSIARKPSEKRSCWDVQWGMAKYGQSKLVIVPSRNLICNIGVGSDSTHAKGMVNSRKQKGFFFIPTHKMEMPMIHPIGVMCDINYDNKVYKSSKRSIFRRIIGRISRYIFA